MVLDPVLAVTVSIAVIAFFILAWMDEENRRALPAALLPVRAAPASAAMVPLPREPMNNNNNNNASRTAAAAVGVKAITFWSSIYQIMNTGAGDDQKDTDCVICLCKLQHGERIAGLECCKHLYHQTCLAEWLKRNLSCPLCRSPVRALWPRCSADIV